MNKVKSEDSPGYETGPEETEDDRTVRYAIRILEARLGEPGACIDNPDKTRQYLALQLAEKEHEVFCLLMLDNKHRVIGFEELFRGTIDGASVSPREVVKEVLARNAAAVILAHNHPSGEPEPSRADITLTRRLVEALALIDVRVLDHMVVGGTEVISFAERGLI